MERYVLTLLNNISLNEINVCNGGTLTCEEESASTTACMACISCKVTLIVKFCAALLNHMTDHEIVSFVHDCVGQSITKDFLSSLMCFLSPLDGKDRTYTKSRARPSLSTDLVDFSLKNYTVNKSHLHRTTAAISEWVVCQPQTLKLQLLASLLSRLKLALLDEIYKGIENLSKSKFSNDMFLNDDKTFTTFHCSSNIQSIGRESGRSINPSYNSEPSIDFISLLPVHISKYILNLLDEGSLKICSMINDTWKTIVVQVRREDIVNQKIKEQSMLLQSQKDGSKEVSTKPIDPCFARDTDVQVPKINPGTQHVMYVEGFKEGNKKKFQKKFSIDNDVDETPIPISRETFNMKVGFKDVNTKTVIMEERNVFCGGYSVLLLTEGIPKQHPPAVRTIAYNSGDLVAVSGSNKIIQFLDIEGRKTNVTKTKIHGHAGTIKVLRIINKLGQTTVKKHSQSSAENINDGEVLSGSYDTTIRRWDIQSGNCLKIYIGHTLTITALDTAENMFASGSMDGTCKLWNYEDGRCIFSMKHKYPVIAVALSSKLCVSGDSFGIVKVWNIENGNLLKKLIGHGKEISAIKVDNFHILTSSLDGYVLLWSSVADFDICIGCFRHPKSVLCMEMMYMRTITGCIDGKIRIWDILTGQCLRIIRGNSKSDPILTMVLNDRRIIINTISNILVLNFEKVEWVYTNNDEEKNKKQSLRARSAAAFKPSSHFNHSSRRFERSRFAGNVDPRIFLSPVTIKSISSTTCNSDKYYVGRLFEDGAELTRGSAWIVTPSFNKSLRLKDKIQEIEEDKNIEKDVIETDENVNEIDGITRTTTNSSSDRRISYGFERQDHLKSNCDLKDVKLTLRKHMRSRPVTAVQALPEFVQTMIMQMKESSNTGRPISSFSSIPLTRRISGPMEVDLRSKLSIQEIKSVLGLSSSINPTLPSSSNENTPKKPKYEPINIDHTTSANIITSAKYSSNRSVVENFFAPKNCKNNLTEKKLDFDRRHKTIVQDLDKKKKISNKSKFTNTITDLHLRTFEASQEYLKQVNKIHFDYEQSKLMSKENEKSNAWLKKATETHWSTFEKDVIRRRPRSAKI